MNADGNAPTRNQAVNALIIGLLQTQLPQDQLQDKLNQL
jgi:hypothetical protein